MYNEGALIKDKDIRCSCKVWFWYMDKQCDKTWRIEIFLDNLIHPTMNGWK
jgi:hypothetical protein